MKNVLKASLLSRYKLHATRTDIIENINLKKSVKTAAGLNFFSTYSHLSHWKFFPTMSLYFILLSVKLFGLLQMLSNFPIPMIFVLNFSLESKSCSSFLFRFFGWLECEKKFNFFPSSFVGLSESWNFSTAYIWTGSYLFIFFPYQVLSLNNWFRENTNCFVNKMPLRTFQFVREANTFHKFLRQKSVFHSLVIPISYSVTHSAFCFPNWWKIWYLVIHLFSVAISMDVIWTEIYT